MDKRTREFRRKVLAAQYKKPAGTSDKKWKKTLDVMVKADDLRRRALALPEQELVSKVRGPKGE